MCERDHKRKQIISKAQSETAAIKEVYLNKLAEYKKQSERISINIDPDASPLERAKSGHEILSAKKANVRMLVDAGAARERAFRKIVQDMQESLRKIN
jgi:hypothetical protein